MESSYPSVNNVPPPVDTNRHSKRVSSGDQSQKTPEETIDSQGTPRISAFYPGVGFTTVSADVNQQHNEFVPYLPHGVFAPQPILNTLSGHISPYPYGPLIPSYSYDISTALATLALEGARARLHSTHSMQHFPSAPATPQATQRKNDFGSTQTEMDLGSPRQTRNNIGKSRSDAATWRKEFSPSLFRSSTVPRPGGSLTFLDRFRIAGGQGYTIETVLGHIPSLALDQTGSRWLQSQLDEHRAKAGNMIIKEILENALLLSRDIFGNYVVQKTFEYSDRQNKDALGCAIKGRMRRLSFDVYGCRVVQKAIQHISTTLALELVAELEEVVIPCVQDMNGNHVIQKCIECLPSDQISSLIEPLLTNVKELGKDQYGCRVIQRSIEYCSVKEIREGILDEIIDNVSDLSATEYGNYVVQHVAEHGGPKHRKKATHRIGTNFRLLSHHKFASRVVEKFLELVDEEDRQYMIESMFPVQDGCFVEEAWALDMMLDPYANYIVQKIFEVCTQDISARFAPILIANRKKLFSSSHGKSTIEAAINYGIIKATDLTLAMLSDASSTITA
jgi:hypothetical protein